ncbi:GntR family transcriptional regulator [Streptomyces diastaticus]|uniref:GntR family transcriptional regulator n=1 Tax=Streptomyces TaxID=1883 RepID=UPI00366A4E92
MSVQKVANPAASATALRAPSTRPGMSLVYRFFSGADELLYVGVTDDPPKRWRHHQRYARDLWWPLAERFEEEWHKERAEAMEAELRAIRTEAPLWNSVHTPSPSRQYGGVERHSARLTHQRWWKAVGGFQGEEWRVFETVARVLREEIASGTYPVGSALPRVADLVNRFGVSAPSARKAVALLEESGDVRCHGRGGGRRWIITPTDDGGPA